MAGTRSPRGGRHARRRHAGVPAVLAGTLLVLGAPACGTGEKETCGMVVETLRPGTSSPYSLHRSDGQIHAIRTDDAWYQPVNVPGELDPTDGTLTVSPDGHTLTFTDRHHRTLRFVEHPGNPYCPL